MRALVRESGRGKTSISRLPDLQEARQELKAAQNQARYEAMGEKDLAREIRRLEKEMLEAARNLEFERAAQLGDQLKAVKQRLFLDAA